MPGFNSRIQDCTEVRPPCPFVTAGCSRTRRNTCQNNLITFERNHELCAERDRSVLNNSQKTRKPLINSGIGYKFYIVNKWKQSVLEQLRCLDSHFVLVWAEVQPFVATSRAGDALSSLEHFSESFFPHWNTSLLLNEFSTVRFLTYAGDLLFISRGRNIA